MKWLYRLIWGNKEPKGPDKEIDEANSDITKPYFKRGQFVDVRDGGTGVVDRHADFGPYGAS